MKTTATTLAAAVLLATSLPAFAGSCPLEMKEIDAALAANPALGAGELDRVRELRAAGERLHKSGNHADSVARLGEAKKLLGI